MARQPKGPATPPTAPRKAKDVISQAVEASAAKVADLGDSIQKSGLQNGSPSSTAKSSRKPAPMRKTAAAETESAPVIDKAPEAATERFSAAAVVDEAKSAVPPTPPPGEVTVGTAAASSPSASQPAVADPPPPPPIVDPVVTESTAERAPAMEAQQPADASTPTAPERAPVVAMPTSAFADGVLPAAACATRSVRESMEAAADGLTAINRKTIEALRTNAGMTFDLIKSLIGVKSVAEAVQVHADHARERFEVMSGQARELHELAAKVTAATAAPLRRGLGQTIRDA